MMKDQGNTLELPMHNGTVIKLKYYNVITLAGANYLVDSSDMRIPYYVQPWIVNMIGEHPEILA